LALNHCTDRISTFLCIQLTKSLLNCTMNPDPVPTSYLHLLLCILNFLLSPCTLLLSINFDGLIYIKGLKFPHYVYTMAFFHPTLAFWILVSLMLLRKPVFSQLGASDLVFPSTIVELRGPFWIGSYRSSDIEPPRHRFILPSPIKNHILDPGRAWSAAQRG